MRLHAIAGGFLLAAACGSHDHRHSLVEGAPLECTFDTVATEVPEPWADVQASSGLSASTAGYSELFRFVHQPTATAGRATVVRLSNPAAGASLFRGEKRTWAVVVELDQEAGTIIGYSYANPAQPDDVWVHLGGIAPTRESGRLRDVATAFDRLCSTLHMAGLRGKLAVVQHTSGIASASSVLRSQTLRPLQLDGPR